MAQMANVSQGVECLALLRRLNTFRRSLLRPGITPMPEWEAEFVVSLLEQIAEGNQLSERQSEIVKTLAKRYSIT